MMMKIMTDCVETDEKLGLQPHTQAVAKLRKKRSYRYISVVVCVSEETIAVSFAETFFGETTQGSTNRTDHQDFPFCKPLWCMMSSCQHL